tara:strand:- start:25 stop:891 length:867 start_codon:yes stop_codon:yes gene_type:complete
MSRRSNKNADKSRLFEEKYLEERDKNVLLKRKTNEQEDTIKRLYTKIQMIEETLRRRGAKGLDGSGTDGVKGSKPRRLADLEAEKLIADLRKRNASLKKDNTGIREKLRISTMALNKAQKRPGARRPMTSSNSRSSNENLDGMLQNFSKSATGAQSKKTRELVSALRSRLVNTEQRLQTLARENSKLRQSGGLKAGRQHPPAPSSSSSSSIMSGDVLDLQRDLRDKTAQLTLLNNRFEHLESRSRASQEIHNKTLNKLEEDNRTIRDLNRKLQMMQHDNEILEQDRQR